MKFLIANWKANLNFEQVENFCQTWEDLLREKNLPVDIEVAVAVTSIFYAWLQQADRHFAVSLQDTSVFSGGAYTGEVTITNLVGLIPKYVILGHSERRREFGETNEVIINKAQHLWELGSTPVICFDLPELDELSQRLANHQEQEFVLAYEPVSAISTSGTAGNLAPDKLQALMPELRQKLYGKPILYGGSVKPENAGAYAGVCAGLLIGSASQSAESFYQIVQAFTKE